MESDKHCGHLLETITKIGNAHFIEPEVSGTCS